MRNLLKGPPLPTRPQLNMTPTLALFEYCRLMSAFDSAEGEDHSARTERAIKRLKFIEFDLRPHFDQSTSLEEKLQKLNATFFKNWGWQVLADHATLQDHIQSGLLESRRLSPWMLSLLYCALAEQMGVNAEPLAFSDTLVKCCIDEESFILNLELNGAVASQEDLHEYLRLSTSHFEINQQDALDTQSPLDFLGWAIQQVASLTTENGNNQQQIRFYNAVLEIFPHEVGALCARGMAYQRAQEPQKAFQDLKRFLLLSDITKVPQTVMSTFKSLCKSQGKIEDYFIVAKSWNENNHDNPSLQF